MGKLSRQRRRERNAALASQGEAGQIFDGTSVQGAHITAEFFQGLLPHPDHLERYEKLQPGTTGKLMDMVERQATHRHSMERKFLNFNGAAQILGVVIGGLFLLGATAGGIWLLSAGRAIEGYATMLGAIAAVGVTFAKQRGDQQKEVRGKGYAEPVGTTVARQR